MADRGRVYRLYRHCHWNVIAFSTNERSATTESGAASGQRMPFPDYVTRPRARSDPVNPSGSCLFSSTPSSRTG